MKNDNFAIKEKNQVINQINIVLFGLGIKHTRLTPNYFLFHNYLAKNVKLLWNVTKLWFTNSKLWFTNSCGY